MEKLRTFTDEERDSLLHRQVALLQDNGHIGAYARVSERYDKFGNLYLSDLYQMEVNCGYRKTEGGGIE